MSAEAENLEAISKGIEQHNSNCPWPASEVRMNPFEVERLGWEEIRGLPIVPDPAIGTGRFRIVCSREGDGVESEETEAVGQPLEVGVGADDPPPPAGLGPSRERPGARSIGRRCGWATGSAPGRGWRRRPSG